MRNATIEFPLRIITRSRRNFSLVAMLLIRARQNESGIVVSYVNPLSLGNVRFPSSSSRNTGADFTIFQCLDRIDDISVGTAVALFSSNRKLRQSPGSRDSGGPGSRPSDAKTNFQGK